MRRDGETVTVNDHVVDRRIWKIELQRLPVGAIIKGCVDSRFRASEEKSSVAGVFADRMNVGTIGNAGGDLRPSLAEVCGLENVGFEVVELVGVDGRIGGAGIPGRSFDEADEGPLGNRFRSSVAPSFAVVAGELDLAVIGAGPDDAFLLGRF